MKKILIVLLSLISLKHVSSQGCSDAGFCSIGSIKPNQINTSSNQRLTIGVTNGIGDENVYVLTPYIQYDNKLSKNWSIQAKITSNYASGNLGSVFGFGDFYVTGIYSKKMNQNWKIDYILSIKAPLNNSNLQEGNKHLPMQYQSSLGTIDAIAGLSFSNKTWQFATAIQQPLSGRNDNNFLPIYWNSASALKYAPSNDFNRKADVLLRANYSTKEMGNLKFNFGLLGIYHLGKDTYIDGNISNKPIELNGSEGLTLNATATAIYKLSKKLSIAGIAGVPIAVREIRPDGLTRSFSISTEFLINL